MPGGGTGKIDLDAILRPKKELRWSKPIAFMTINNIQAVARYALRTCAYVVIAESG